MRSLDDLHRAVAATLASKRLGSPVFVRYLVQSPIAARAVPRFLAQLAQVVTSWLGQELFRIYAVGSVKNRHLTLTLEYQGGAAAQVSWTSPSTRGPGVDLMLVGNRGALYHDVGHANSWDAGLTLAEAETSKELIAWIERALRSGRPETAKGGTP